MNFVTYKELMDDCRAFALQLPADYLMVLGCGRSGMIPASYLALFWNISVANVDEFVARNGNIPARSPRQNSNPKTKKILVVDDSMNTGNSMKKIQQQLQPFSNRFNFEYGALYTMNKKAKCFRVVPAPRVFEWNLFNSAQIKHSCCDLDGVFAVDQTFVEQDNDPRYINHIKTVAPLYRTTTRVGRIVTSRLEKHRKITENWLARNGVRYGHLHMSQYKTPQQRRNAGNHAQYKAKIYMESKAILFVESSIQQAQGIARISKKPVLCTDKMVML